MLIRPELLKKSWNSWSLYYSLLGLSSVWSESSSSRTKISEFESSIENSLDPDPKSVSQSVQVLAPLAMFCTYTHTVIWFDSCTSTNESFTLNNDQMNHGTYATSVTILATLPLRLNANILGKCLIILKNNIIHERRDISRTDCPSKLGIVLNHWLLSLFMQFLAFVVCCNFHMDLWLNTPVYYMYAEK